MTRFLPIAAVGAALVMAVAVSANAAPLSPQAPGAETAIAKVHGYHRSCRNGHRHQRDGDRVSCGYYYRDSAPSIYLNLGRDRHRHHHHHRHHGRRDRH